MKWQLHQQVSEDKFPLQLLKLCTGKKGCACVPLCVFEKEDKETNHTWSPNYTSDFKKHPLTYNNNSEFVNLHL